MSSSQQSILMGSTQSSTTTQSDMGEYAFSLANQGQIVDILKKQSKSIDKPVPILAPMFIYPKVEQKAVETMEFSPVTFTVGEGSSFYVTFRDSEDNIQGVKSFNLTVEDTKSLKIEEFLQKYVTKVCLNESKTTSTGPVGPRYPAY
jgi:hypothetical protein